MLYWEKHRRKLRLAEHEHPVRTGNPIYNTTYNMALHYKEADHCNTLKVSGTEHMDHFNDGGDVYFKSYTVPGFKWGACFLDEDLFLDIYRSITLLWPLERPVCKQAQKLLSCLCLAVLSLMPLHVWSCDPHDDRLHLLMLTM